jgi:hypothetical protein
MTTTWPDKLDDHSSGFAGAGGTLGWRWDRLNGVTATARGIFGGWTGGGYTPKPPQHTCTQWYVSVAAGIRGDEVYVTPKLGGVCIPPAPDFSMNWGSAAGGSGWSWH